MKNTLFFTLSFILFIVTDSKAQFRLTNDSSYTLGKRPFSVCTNDFNGDGILDIATANNTSGSVSILIGTGVGSFMSATTYSVGNDPKYICSGDFNNDSYIDLATTNGSVAGNNFILLGTGTGSFTVTSYTLPSSSYFSINTADFNNDGNLDLVTASNVINCAVVLIGTGTGSFMPATTYSVGNNPRHTCVGDFNNDGNMDIATANSNASNSLSILLGTGTGSFAPAVNYSASYSFDGRMCTGDFNNDGNLDIACTIYSMNFVYIFHGTGTGSFTNAPVVTLAGTLSAIITGDYNNDGFLDLLASGTQQNIYMSFGTAGGGFTSVVSFPLNHSSSTGLCKGDFNNDGFLDVATANYGNTADSSVTIFLNQSIYATISHNNVACSGGATGSATVVASGGVPPYTYLWAPTGSTSVNVNGLVAGNYTVIITGADSYTTTASVTITEPSAIMLNAGASKSVCAGTTLTLSALASGGILPYSYQWSPASAMSAPTNQSTLFTPTITTVYTLTVLDSNTCVKSKTITITVKPNKTISGPVINETAGNVVLYKYSPILSLWDSISSTTITSNAYNFGLKDSAKYVVKIIPNSTSNQITYAPNAVTWQNASIINHGCTNNSVQTVSVMPFATIGTGSGFISGNITEGVGFGQRPFFGNNTNNNTPMKPSAPGNPIGGIIVKGGKNPGGQMFMQTVTDVNGSYTLTNMPNNNVGEGYFIIADIPGIDTSSTYHLIMTSNDNQFTNMDFVVDSAYIKPVSTIGVKEIQNDEFKIIVYPNPVLEYITIDYELKNSANVYIKIFDLLGKTVKVLHQQSQSVNKYNQRLSLTDLQSGIYFIAVQINNEQRFIKIIKEE